MKREDLVHDCPSTVLWKQVTFCLVSQVHNWRAILLQNEPPSTPPVLPTCDLVDFKGELLDSRAEAGKTLGAART